MTSVVNCWGSSVLQRSTNNLASHCSLPLFHLHTCPLLCRDYCQGVAIHGSDKVRLLLLKTLMGLTVRQLTKGSPKSNSSTKISQIWTLTDRRNGGMQEKSAVAAENRPILCVCSDVGLQHVHIYTVKLFPC